MSAPSTDGRAAFQVPTYKSFWNSNSFLLFNNADTAAAIGEEGYTACFHTARRWDEHPDARHASLNMLYSHADLIAIKDKRRIAGSPLLR